MYELSEIFALGLCAYVVMSNHLHVVLYADQLLPSRWSDEEVGERRVRLLLARVGGNVDEDACSAKREALLNDPARFRELRGRLGSVSWFMNCLSEPIVRRANREDGCTGRFSEGCFQCQAFLDEAVVTACMAYVDLNPVRAGIAGVLPDSDHTSTKQRLESVADTSEVENLWKGEILRPSAGA